MDLISIDIGGSTIKMIVCKDSSLVLDWIKPLINSSWFVTKIENRQYHFLQFEKSQIELILSMIPQTSQIILTGGGSKKYTKYKDIDEMSAIEHGLRFFSNNEILFTMPDLKTKTALVMSVGTGTSILRINSHECVRLSGSAIGGGTFVQLGKALTRFKTWKEMIQGAKQGNKNNVSLTVGDIYEGKGIPAYNLSPDTIASDLGKLKTVDNQSDNDIIAAILSMVTYNIAQLAWLHARLEKVSDIIFVGSFVQKDLETCLLISKSISYWSKNTMQAHFITLNSYVCAMGALQKVI